MLLTVFKKKKLVFFFFIKVSYKISKYDTNKKCIAVVEVEDGEGSELSSRLRPLPLALVRLEPRCPRGLQRTKAQWARPAHHQKDSVFSFLFSGSGKCWILEGNNLPFQAKLKRPRLWNLRIPSLVLPCSS